MQGIVRGHHGAIKVYCEPGRGTSFKLLFLPFDLEQNPFRAKNDKSTGWRGGGMVVIADDDDGIRLMTTACSNRSISAAIPAKTAPRPWSC